MIRTRAVDQKKMESTVRCVGGCKPASRAKIGSLTRSIATKVVEVACGA